MGSSRKNITEERKINFKSVCKHDSFNVKFKKYISKIYWVN